MTLKIKWTDLVGVDLDVLGCGVEGMVPPVQSELLAVVVAHARRVHFPPRLVGIYGAFYIYIKPVEQLLS